MLLKIFIGFCASVLAFANARAESHWGGPREELVNEQEVVFPGVEKLLVGNPRWAWNRLVRNNPEGRPAARIHITNIETGGDGDYELRVTDQEGRVVEVIDSTRLQQFNEIWTSTVFSAAVRLEVYGDDAGSKLNFRVRAIASENRTGSPEGIYGENNFVPFDAYSGEFFSSVKKAGRSVVRLSFSQFGDTDFCTGSLVAPNVVMTSYHCMPFESRCRNMKAQFDYAFEPVEIGCQKFIASDSSIAVGLFQLESPAKGREVLNFASAEPQGPANMMIIQHPQGRSKQVTLLDCVYDRLDPSGNNAVYHTCDTEPGSSGAPLLSLKGEIIGIHDHGSGMSPESRSPNVGKRLKVVRAFVGQYLHLPAAGTN